MDFLRFIFQVLNILMFWERDSTVSYLCQSLASRARFSKNLTTELRGGAEVVVFSQTTLITFCLKGYCGTFA